MFKIAFQIDDLARLNFRSDSTYILMQESFKRMHKIYFYYPKTLSWINNTVCADVCEVTNILEVLKLQNGENPILHKNAKTMNLEMFDMIFLRQDPPFDMGYITSTFLLEKIMTKVKIVNNPISVRNSPEKLLVTNFVHLMPKTIITSSKKAILNFLEEQQECVIKPLYGNGGSNVFFLKQGDYNTNSIIEYFLNTFKEQIMVQEFLPNVRNGDKRIILIEGEPLGVINRIPAINEIRSNLVAGGTAELIDLKNLSERELYICQEISQTLKDLELFLVGIDVIDGYLTEINVTSPTGLRPILSGQNINLATLLLEKLETKLKQFQNNPIKKSTITN